MLDAVHWKSTFNELLKRAEWLVAAFTHRRSTVDKKSSELRGALKYSHTVDGPREK
jgi:hypothetical protein